MIGKKIKRSLDLCLKLADNMLIAHGRRSNIANSYAEVLRLVRVKYLSANNFWCIYWTSFEIKYAWNRPNIACSGKWINKLIFRGYDVFKILEVLKQQWVMFKE